MNGSDRRRKELLDKGVIPSVGSIEGAGIEKDQLTSPHEWPIVLSTGSASESTELGPELSLRLEK